jgi:hypothetical protein
VSPPHAATKIRSASGTAGVREMLMVRDFFLEKSAVDITQVKA